MKKYKQVVAALLAMNLTIYVMPTGVVNISAAVESQGKEDTTEEVQKNSADSTNAVSAEEDLTSDAEVSDNTDNTETPSSDTTDTDIEIADENVDNNGDAAGTESSGDTELSSGEQEADDLFSDGTQQNAAAAEQPEEISEAAVQADNNRPLDLEQLDGYNSSNNTMTIDSNQDLILLSNCDQEKVARITINFISVGQVDVTETNKIPAGTDIGPYLKATTSTASEEENQPAEETETSGETDTADMQENTGENTENITQEDSAEGTEDDTQRAAAQPVIADRDYTYQGIGDAEHPFQGEITGTIPGDFKIDNSFFGGLSSKAKVSSDNKKITWCGTGDTPMAAKVYQFDSAPEDGQDSHVLPITMQGNSSATMGSLIGTVKAASDDLKTEVLTIGSDTVTYGSNVKAVSASGNSGLICETLESGIIRLDGCTFPDNAYTVQSTAAYNSADTSAAGNAGGVIGVMKTGTTLDIRSAVNIRNATVTSANGNAGGITGLMQQGAKIVTTGTVTLTKPNVTGGINAGGAVGMAEDVTFADSDIQGKITVANSTVKANGTDSITASAGGFAGKYTLNAANLGETGELSFPEQVTVDETTLTVNNSGLAGGYFGHLDLNGNLTYTIGGADSSTKKEIKPTYKDCNARDLGGVAGKVTNTEIAGTLVIQNMAVTATKENDTGINYHGGLVGELGEVGDSKKAVYLKVSNSDIKVNNPQVSENNDGNNSFGGVAGALAEGSILKTENTVTVDTCGTNINWGGGIAGYAQKSVIDLSGKTDLSKALYAANNGKKAREGWLAGRQDCALIYAEGDGNGNGWTYIRGRENTRGKQAVNDIGNYGQIIRLHSGGSASRLSSNLISIDENHAVNYTPSTEAAFNGKAIEIGSADAFALLSIAWNSRGCFGGVTNFSVDNVKSGSITLSADIDLTGSGIAGLTRDTYSNDDIYSGTFDGGSHTVTLATGETFGYKQNATDTLATEEDYGYGEVISAGSENHGRQGLFAKVICATVKNVKINGKINISNTEEDILAGGIAGELTGNGKGDPSLILGVTAEEKITADCSNATGGIMAGGLFGGSYNSSPVLQLGEFGNSDTLNTVAAEINLKNCTSATNDTKINAGGVVGEVGESAFTFTANCLKVGGSIQTSVQKRAYIGGLIGIIKGRDDSVNHQIQIKSVTFDGFKIDAPNATEACGGLFGSIWTNVGVYFMGEDDANNGTDTKLDVADAQINAPEAEYAGGLAYRSSGNWEIRDHGINLQKLVINANKDVGLLVCKGEKKSNEEMAGEKRAIGALYLSTTKYWETSYQINEADVSINTAKTGVFDEFVAYTSPSAKEIIDNNKNGIVSIATQEENGTRVGVDVSGCTTYQNRTAYGKTHPVNTCSRYYYDLDQCLTDVAEGTESSSNNNKRIDTPQELLLWSVYNYASANIRDFFTKTSIGQKPVPDITTHEYNKPWMIGYDKNLNMEKYSYYPIQFAGGSVNVMDTELTFNNEKIETAEKNAGNKSTQGITESSHTQHYMMHCGLFLTYQSPGGVFTIRNVKFSGNIGMVNNSTSGVLVADFASGNLSGTAIKSIRISIEKIVLNGLKVNNCGENYAPLLINNISDRSNSSYIYGYSTLNVDGVTTENYQPGTAAASSLIGTVGSYRAKQVNMTFQNIVLPDKKADGTNGIFSHATLLEHFAYDKDDNGSGATYNFYNAEDWKGTQHIHEVTYGKEITGSTEFTDLQKWYYDESTYTTDDGLVYDNADNRKNFDASGYLPYVCTAYDKDNCMHEIKVNQRVVDIINGCGTYGHPYRITKEEEMKILSGYMAGDEPRKDWRVTVSGNQSTLHTAKSDTDYTSDQDVTYQYNGNGYWVQVVNKATDGKDDWQTVDGNIQLDKDFMRNYLLNAYYDIQGKVVQGSDNTVSKTPEFTLTNFKGFGTMENPFRGVITSKNNTTVVLQGEETGNGLIPYSYGCVVKNLKISYRNEGKTLTYTNDDKNAAIYYPKVCFGGVIGCVMGGDNIIDGVTVDMNKDWLTFAGKKKHLIQAGGYVGSVSGGGVIFRNMGNAAGLTDDAISNAVSEISVGKDANYSLYVNPYVGRVLDGFAFCESSSKEDGLENTDKNYKINTLVTTDTGCVDISGNTVTVKDAQGLLVLSAVVNSGAASKGISNAYSRMGKSDGQVVQYTTSDGKITYLFGGKYGKVRNASYSEIGTKDNDAALSGTEDKNLPGEGNLPYLISTYCNKKSGIFSASTNSDLEICLAADNTTGFDMTGYGNGYQGIAARYVSNAIRGHVDNNISNHPECIVPELKSFNGNGRTVTVNMQVREYADDDFHAASVGGMFNVLRVSPDGKISDLTVNKNAKNVKNAVSLEYYSADGAVTNVEKTAWSSCEDAGVGVLAGSLVGYTSENGNRDITMENIQVDEAAVTSPGSAGGIVGNTGKPVANTESKGNSTDMSVLLQREDSQIAYGIAFNNCSYKNLTVSGKYAAGGFAGYIGNKEQNPRSSVNGYGFTGTLSRTNTGESSAISATDSSSRAGGLFGYVGTRMFINMTDAGEKKTTQTVLQNVSVNAGSAAGGCIGYINKKCYGIHNVIVKGTGTSAVNVSLPEKTPTGTFYAGGIVGYAEGTVQKWTTNWKYAGGISGSSVENAQINNEEKASAHDYPYAWDKLKTNYIAGGIVGQTSGGKTRIEGCTVTDSKVYGSVAGGITGQTDSEIQFIACETKGNSQKKAELKGFSTAGGILGFWTGGNAATVQDCKVQYLDVEGKDWGVGCLVGDAEGSGNGVGLLYLFNSSAQNSDVTASGKKDKGGGRWPCVGGIIGNLRNTIKASNVLLSGITLDSTDGTSKTTKGLLFGNVANENLAVNIAGISIQNIPDDNKSWPLTGKGNISSDNDYIAFSDYAGTALDDSKKGSSTDLLGADVAEPYAATSPKNSTLKLYESESSDTPEYLYGDGAYWTAVSGDGVEAKEIWTNRKQVTNGHYAYKKISDNENNSVSDFKFDSAISTYSANNPTDSTTQKAEDFPVIQIGAGSADTVKDYLNILTNGAFSAANSMNTSNDKRVIAKVDVYQEINGRFVKKANATPAFNVGMDSSGKITFVTTTDYDNGRNRFNLLTVTFTEKDADGKEHKYNVLVPVLVRRMLEINFSATLSYGTNFREENYKNLKSHVLESFGSSITAYLTYTYNSDENGNYTDYGWQSYINAGGDVSVPMKRELCFKQGSVNLPAGTQLSLVDCRDGKAYYYTVDNPTQNINLEDFKDSDGKAYEPPSIAELMHAAAKAEAGGTFVKVDADGKPEGADDDKTYSFPTVRIRNEKTKEYEYYRRAESGEKGTYTITVDENNLKDSSNKSTVGENYYLVITVPKTSNSDPLNGSLQTGIKNDGIANQIHYRTIQGGVDDHNNKASTYLISKGYQQELKENTAHIGYIYKKMNAEENVMKVDVVDKITFPNGQAYLDEGEIKDELYQRFVGSLQKTINNKTSAEQFPSGTTGQANFYVYKMNGTTRTYYKYDSKGKTWKAAGTEETVATGYTWTSDGGNMELPLADGTIDNVISLQGVRNLVRNGANTGDSTFYVEVRMDATIPAAGLDVIPESAVVNDAPRDYTKFVYSSQLSTEKTSLSYSTNRAAAPNTQAAYYREEPEGAKLTYEADQLGQLGINLLDLQYLDTSEQHSLIDTTARYDLSTVKNLNNALKNSTGIKFTLSLSLKNTNATENQEGYQAALADADKYLSVEVKSKDSGTVNFENSSWSWTVPKDTYWKNDTVNTDSVFDGSILTQAIQLKVNVDNVEDPTVNHFYSNYQVTLKAEILEGTNPSVGSGDDNIIYTLAKIKPEFVD